MTQQEQEQRTIPCNQPLVAGYRRDKSAIMHKCGRSYAGEMLLCEACEAFYCERYPQGWRGYPGDTCKHGVYVGGIGVDYMCSLCESGQEPPEPVMLHPQEIPLVQLGTETLTLIPTRFMRALELEAKAGGPPYVEALTAQTLRQIEVLSQSQ